MTSTSDDRPCSPASLPRGEESEYGDAAGSAIAQLVPETYNSPWDGRISTRLRHASRCPYSGGRCRRGIPRGGSVRFQRPERTWAGEHVEFSIPIHPIP